MGTSVINQLYSLITPRKAEKTPLLTIKSTPPGKIGFRTMTFKENIILYHTFNENEFKPYYDIYNCRRHYEYIVNKYNKIDFPEFDLDEDAYKLIPEENIYMTTQKLNMIIVDDESCLDSVKNEIYSNTTIYSGYMIQYDFNTKIYFKDYNCLDNFSDILNYHELIKPISHYESGIGVDFIDDINFEV